MRCHVLLRNAKTLFAMPEGANTILNLHQRGNAAIPAKHLVNVAYHVRHTPIIDARLAVTLWQ